MSMTLIAFATLLFSSLAITATHRSGVQVGQLAAEIAPPHGRVASVINR